jgi:predicted transcriptional regulator
MKNSGKISAVRKVSFQADHAFLERLDAAARATGVTRSWLIRAVVQGWMADKKLPDKKLGVKP